MELAERTDESADDITAAEMDPKPRRIIDNRGSMNVVISNFYTNKA